MTATNLLEETLQVLATNGKTLADVLWCGSPDFYFTWQDFVVVADTANYYSGFGSQEVACDLLVVGENWWLERYEYDGAERWEFKTLPVKPDTYNLPKRLSGGSGWISLLEQQKEEEQEY